MRNRIKSEIISKFHLKPHPEGGFFRETYRASRNTEEGSRKRNFSTAIYYLLDDDDFSAFHRINSDELWHFYSGDVLEIVEITSSGNLKTHLLGSDFMISEPQVIIPAGSWFAAHLMNNNSFAFVGCTVAPGFDFEDFEMAKRDDLLKTYPDFTKKILELTRK